MTVYVVDTVDRVVKARRRSESRLLRLVDFLTRGAFKYFIVTIHPFVYVPDGEALFAATLRHEAVHLAQQERWPKALRWLWFVAYLCLPLPVLFAWFRWKAEREAYLENVRRDGYDVEQVVNFLWRSYLWTWPRAWMRAWFKAR